MSESLGIAAGAVTLAIGILTLVGLTVRYVLLPYLREQLRLTRETHTQLTAESAPAAAPTVREEITEIREEQHRHAGEIEDATLELQAMAMMFDGHLDWAQNQVDRLRRERQAMVDEIWRELKSQRAGGHRPRPDDREEEKMSAHPEERETERPVPAEEINAAPTEQEPDHD